MQWTSWLILALTACGDGSSGAATSVPVQPTIDLSNPEASGLKWVDLEGFVGTDAPGVPDMVQPLALGMSEAETRRTLDSLRDTRLPMPKVVQLDGYRVISAPLAASEQVGVSAIVDVSADKLDQIDVSVPSDQALFALTQAWGPPTMETHPELGPVAVWTNPATKVRVELSQAPDEGRSVLKVREAPPPAAD